MKHKAQIAELGTDTTIGRHWVESWVNASDMKGVMHEDICSGCCSGPLRSPPHGQGSHSCQLPGVMSAKASWPSPTLEIVLPPTYICPGGTLHPKLFTGRQGCRVPPNDFHAPKFLSLSLFLRNST